MSRHPFLLTDFYIGAVLMCVACTPTRTSSPPTPASTVPTTAARAGGPDTSSQSAAPTQWRWAGVELTGNRSATRAAIIERIGLRIGDPYTGDRTQWDQWSEQLKTEFGFHEVRIGAVRYVGGETYLVVDVIEAGDEARDVYAPEPTGHVELPTDVMDVYTRMKTYQQGLFEASTPAPENAEKGFLDYDEPQMTVYAHELAQITPQHRRTLLDAIARDADAQTRANAATLLNWAGDVQMSIEAIVPYLSDPSAAVRNNLTRFMLHYVALIESEALRRAIVDALVVQLDRPSHGDRNKALYAMLFLAGNDPPLHSYIMQQAGPTIRAIAENSVLSNVRDPARDLVNLNQ